MDLKEKFIDCLLAYKKVSSTKDYQTYSQYTSFNIKEDDFIKQITLYDILNENSEKVFKDVVIFNKKENDVLKMDYVLFNKGNIILIKTCNYEGDLYFKSKREMILKTSSNNQEIQARKKDPKKELVLFKKGFIRYLNRIKFKYKKNSIKMCVLFTNNNLIIKDNTKYSNSNQYFILEDLLKYIKDLPKVRRNDYSKLILPSYDKAYQMGKGFFNIAIIDDYFVVDNKKYPVSDFKFITFNSKEDENSLLVRYDATYTRLLLNKRKINSNSKTNLNNLNIDFLAINTQLHNFKNPEYLISELKEKTNVSNNCFVTSLTFLFIGFVLGLVCLIIYLVDKSKTISLVLSCIGGLLLVSSLINLLYSHLKIKKYNKKIKMYEDILTESRKLETFNDDIELVDGEIVLKEKNPLLKIENKDKKEKKSIFKLFKKGSKK